MNYIRTYIIVVHSILGASFILNAKEEPTELAPASITTARLQGNDKNIKDFPANITVITQRDIELSSASSVSEILGQQIGIITPDNGGGRGAFSTIRMRGFGEKPAVAILVDGIRIEDSGTGNASLKDLPTSEIERIEIIRGSSSVNYGEGAIAGAINIITKSNQSNAFSSSIGAEIGSYGLHKQRLSGGGMNGNFAYRLSLDREKWDGWRDYSGHDSWVFSMKPEYIYDTGRLTLNLRHSEIVDENPGALDLDTWSTSPRMSDPTKRTKYDSKQTHSSLTWVSNPSDATIIIAKLFGQRRESYVNSFWGNSKIEQPSRGYAFEISVDQNFLDLPHEFIIGHELETRDYNNIAENWGDLFMDWKNIGFFIQDRFSLLENTELKSGIRYDNRDWNISSGGKWEKNGKAWSPKLSLIQKLYENLTGWVSLSRSFRFPTGDDIAYSSNLYGSTSNPDLDPIDAKTLELGFRFSDVGLFDGSITYYSGKIEDDIVFDPNSGWGANINHDTKRQGVEISLRSNSSGIFRPFGGISWTQSRFEDGAYDNKDLPLVPLWQFTGGIDFHLSDSWSVRLEGLNIKEQTAINDLQNNLPTNDYFLLNSSVRYRKGDLGLFFAIKNLTDEEYETYPTSSGGVIFRNPAPGISLRTGLNYEF
tara:strand:+ start:1191 stop:3140 length:1950 start_codon:yes stop_codon:yes gene_type:complete